MTSINRHLRLLKARRHSLALTLLLALSLIGAPLAIFHGSSAHACAPVHHCEYNNNTSYCTC